ncbi:MAG: hypothetical protein N2D54_11655, partial [Chloroflexota bacterium]
DKDSFAEVNGLTFFVMDDGVHGSEIWKTDGTAAGTQLLADLYPGEYGSQPYYLDTAGDFLYFVANIDGNGFDVYSYDTTILDTQIFADGFESGDTSAWSAVIGAGSIDSLAIGTSGSIQNATQYNAAKGIAGAGGISAEGGCKICINFTDAMEGAYDLSVILLNKKPHFIQDNSPAAEKYYEATLDVDLSQLEMKNLSKLTLVTAKKNKARPCMIEISRKLTKIQMRPAVQKTAGGFAYGVWKNVPKGPFTLKMKWKAANNGFLKLFANGDLTTKKTGVANNKKAVSVIQIGSTKKIKLTHSILGPLFIDNFYSAGK